MFPCHRIILDVCSEALSLNIFISILLCIHTTNIAKHFIGLEQKHSACLVPLLGGTSNQYPQHIFFGGEIGENINTFWMKKVLYLMLLVIRFALGGQ